MKAIFSIVLTSMLFIFSGSAIAANGSNIYKVKCSMCHGPTGTGTPMGPTVKGNEFVTKGKAEDIKKVIIEGRSGSNKKYSNISIDMPKVPMSDEDVKALISFLQGDLQK